MSQKDYSKAVSRDVSRLHTILIPYWICDLQIINSGVIQSVSGVHVLCEAASQTRQTATFAESDVEFTSSLFVEPRGFGRHSKSVTSTAGSEPFVV